MSNDSEALGVIGKKPYLTPADLPAIWSEWIALIPLVIYLASYGFSHTLVGKTALCESIGVGFFPKLGVIGSIVDLLKGSSEYIDKACSISEFRREVWDVNWGSVFPCVNGAASDIITKYALQRAGPPIKTSNLVKDEATQATPAVPQFRRPQTLHVLQCTRKKDEAGAKPNALPASILLSVLLLGGAVVSYLYGLYGTFAALLISVAFQASQQCIKVQSPSEYLGDNEHGRVMGCMLVAVHQNASTWYLYTGERGIIDGILNKSMIHSVGACYDTKGTVCMIWFLRLLSLLQLLDLTFVAAQKGWDGIGLSVVLLVAWIAEDVVYSESRLAKVFLGRYRIQITAKTFEFTGRTPMLGAIQLFKGNPVDVWMDGILVASDRRKVWLKKLSGTSNNAEDVALETGLDPDDKDWVSDNYTWSMDAEILMKQEFNVA